LRHIERTTTLIHIIDINSTNPEKDYQDIKTELKEWNPELVNKKEIIVLNKADTMPQKDAQKIAKDLSKKIKKDVLIISAVSGKGIKELLEELI